MVEEVAVDDLSIFLYQWMAQRPFAVPFHKPVIFDDGIWGAVLYRKKPWQVQLFILAPHTVVPEHVHPNVDSFEVYLSGDIEFSIGGKCPVRDILKLETPIELLQGPDENGNHKLFGSYIRVHPDVWHGAKTREKGGCFLSVQHWLNGIEPTNVGDDWGHKGDETRRNFASP